MEICSSSEIILQPYEVKDVKQHNKNIQIQHRQLSILYKDICNNCSKHGHNSHQCKIPITSFGVVVFRNHPVNGKEYLMICRKDTLGYIDFIRGKYTIVGEIKQPTVGSPCLQYIMHMIKQMTIDEKHKLQTKTFQELWRELWGGDGNIQPQYKLEETTSRNKFNDLKNSGALNELIRISIRDFPAYEEPEYGFPKGRRGFGEKDYSAAIRETVEETGMNENSFVNIKNVLPFSEVFMGSNYHCYKHQYYLMYMHYNNSLNTTHFERSEVSAMKWMTFDECIQCIRPYNVEKKRMLTSINTTIELYNM